MKRLACSTSWWPPTCCGQPRSTTGMASSRASDGWSQNGADVTGVRLNGLVRVSDARPIADRRIDQVADEPLSKGQGRSAPWRSNHASRDGCSHESAHSVRPAAKFGAGCRPGGSAGAARLVTVMHLEISVAQWICALMVLGPRKL